MKSSSPHWSSVSSRRQMQVEWLFHRAKYFYRPKTSWCVLPPNGGCRPRELADPGCAFFCGGSAPEKFKAETKGGVRAVCRRIKLRRERILFVGRSGARG